MDFFSPKCQSGPFSNAQFGVCDDHQGLPAYVNTSDASTWIATVKNPSQIPVTFTAIDKCVIRDGDELGRGRCDAMLTTDSLLYLIELKDQRSDWRQHAYDQLQSTIEFLLAHNRTELNRFQKKKAFACNRKHPAFVEQTQEMKRRFSRHGFRLDTQATVVLAY